MTPSSSSSSSTTPKSTLAGPSNGSAISTWQELIVRHALERTEIQKYRHFETLCKSCLSQIRRRVFFTEAFFTGFISCMTSSLTASRMPLKARLAYKAHNMQVLPQTSWVLKKKSRSRGKEGRQTASRPLRAPIHPDAPNWPRLDLLSLSVA